MVDGVYDHQVEAERERTAAEEGRKIRWLSVREMSLLLKVSEARIRRWARKRRLPWHKVGNRVLFMWLEIEPLIPAIWRRIGRPELLEVSTSPEAKPEQVIDAHGDTLPD